MKKLLIGLFVLSMSLSCWGNNLPPYSGTEMGPDDLWEIWGGQLELDFNTDNFRDFNIEVNHSEKAVNDGQHLITIRDQSNFCDGYI